MGMICFFRDMTPGRKTRFAFGVTEKDKMYIAPEKRISIW